MVNFSTYLSVLHTQDMTKIKNAEWVLQQQKSKKKFFIFLNYFSQHRALTAISTKKVNKQLENLMEKIDKFILLFPFLHALTPSTTFISQSRPHLCSLVVLAIMSTCGVRWKRKKKENLHLCKALPQLNRNKFFHLPHYSSPPVISSV